MIALAQLLSRWSALSRAARLLAGAVAIAVLALAVSAVLLGHPSRCALFVQPLHPEQLTEVEERLAAWNVPFTPAADNVIIDARRRNDVLLRLSLAGVPHEHLFSTGEAMANIGVLTPQSVVDAQTRAGLSGDIEAGLRGIDGVDDARVIVAPAKPPEFADGTAEDASASVRLRLRGDAQLTHEAVAGIRAFVAASVPELRASRVTILDDRGVALTDDARAGDDAADLQHSLQSALDGVYGEGAAIVRVRTEFDGTQYAERDVRRLPVGAQAIQALRRSESFDGNGKHYRHVEQGEDRGSDTHELVSRVPSGAIKRVSTAVFVDETRALDLAKVRELAAAAVGFNGRRGDTLAVEAVDFRRPAVAHKDAWWLLYGAIVPLAPGVILTIGLVACTRIALPALTSLIRELAERAAVGRASKAAAGFAPGRVRTMLEREPPHAAAAIISALPAATATAVLELYPPHEREAIVSRMQRRHSPLLDNAHELLRDRA
ncbi:MAG: hypothetical protein JO190_06475 [Candidatus Eremiobacteraeota bacterium]|nr:hypothetical protein [Candidatus Eremiobacteraeota bacterium]MBV8499117.1 hypothetical protein [Candidatus Eremiobacteraeota bacterium]